MSDFHGKFVWYELMTTEAPAEESFYRNVVGWGAKDAGHPNGHYTLLSAGKTQVGGLMALPAEACAAGVRPGWIGYVAVDDVDAYAERVTKAGGVVRRAPDDIPAVGRFAVVTDPQGARFILFKPFSTDMQGELPVAGTPGHTGWHELHTTDWERAFSFYAELFGWQKAQAVDMGPMGIYQTFSTGGEPVGGMMTTGSSNSEASSGPFWLYYTNVEEIQAAAVRVKDNGGQVLQGPHQVPGGSWIIQCRDPQGLMFALVGPHG